MPVSTFNSIDPSLSYVTDVAERVERIPGEYNVPLQHCRPK